MKTAATSPPAVLGLAVRVGLFALIGWIGVTVFAFLFYPISGLLVAAAMSVFAAAAVANAIAVRVFERARLADCGLGWSATSAREFFAGAGTGMGLAAFVILVPLALGQVRFAAAPGSEHPWLSFPFVAIMLLFGAAGEEMLFHGYAFQLLVRRLGAFATILPAAVLFGLAHLSNQGANALGVANTMAWGGALGYAYYRTGALWLPIGLHFGWNLMLPLLGANMSGFTIGVTGYALEWKGSGLWGGGSYGPEGGIPTTVAVVVLGFLLPRLSPESAEREEVR
jgi:membrane protease YdiL (CAAX protease family)